MNPPRTVALIEDDSELRESFREMLATAASGWSVTGSYARAETAIPAITAAPPDMVITDIQLPGMSGIECLRKLKPLCPATQFLMVTVYENADRVYEALAAGASGYLLKRDAPLRLLESLEDVLGGGSPMSSAIARKVVQHFQRSIEPEPQSDPVVSETGTLDLTSRETEVLDLLVKGLLYKEMADRLEISVVTVRYHLQNIYRKLHVRTRTEAAVKFLGR